MAFVFDRGKNRSVAAAAALGLFALALLAAAPPRAVGNTAAVSVTAVLSVTATVNPNCTLSTSPLSFGRYESLQANATIPLNGSGTVSIACTKGSAPRINLDLGQNANGTRRYMTLAGGGAADALYYELYQPPAAVPGVGCLFPGSAAWGPTPAQAFVPSAPANRAARTFNVCGTIPPGQFVSVGSYADTVVATVNF